MNTIKPVQCLGIPILILISLGFSQAQIKSDEDVVRINVLQVGDVRQFTPVDGGNRGGLARLMTIRKRIGESSCTLLLFAGDTLNPSVESVRYKGAQMIEAWNMAGLDYAVFGDHEFDFGPTVLRERMQESKFTWLGANVIDKRTGTTFGGGSPYVIRELNGVKIGIIGFTTLDAKHRSRPGPDAEFLDPCETAKKLVPEMRAQGAQAIVGLTHLIFEEDKKLASCAKFDVILGGHDQVVRQASFDGTLLLKVSTDARELNRVEIRISRATGKLDGIEFQTIPITASIPEDREFSALTEKYKGLLDRLAEPIGRTTVPLDARFTSNRTNETNLGDFITDAMRHATGVDVAILNGGALRADTIIPPGTLTMRDLLWILPFSNRLVLLEATGETILQALEHSVGRSAEDERPGRFLQISGMAFSFDASRPPGARVLNVTVGGRLLEKDKLYKLATIDYLLQGGDGYSMFRSSRVLSKPDETTIDEVVRRSIAGVVSIAPRTDGRIKRTDTIEARLESAFTCVYDKLSRGTSKLDTITGSSADGLTVVGYDAEEVRALLEDTREYLLASLREDDMGGMRAYVEKHFPLPKSVPTIQVVTTTPKPPQTRNHHLAGLPPLGKTMQMQWRRLISIAQVGSILSLITDFNQNRRAIRFKIITEPDQANVTLTAANGKTISASTYAEFPAFWRGTYTITVTRAGFKTVIQRDQDLWRNVVGLRCRLFRNGDPNGPLYCQQLSQ